MHVVIYDQEGVTLYKDISDAAKDILPLYGEKLGSEACAKLAKGRPGTVYRRYGGPRIELVSDADAERILSKEAVINAKT